MSDPHFLELSDGELQTEDGCSFPIHKIQLARKSKYFYRLFCEDTDKTKRHYLIPDISGEILGAILDFTYSGTFYATEFNVNELLVAADRFLMDDLIMKIRDVIGRDHLTVENSLPLFLTALRTDRKDIVKRCFWFILTNFQSVVAVHGSALSQLPQHVLEQFLSNSSLCVSDEAQVWAVVCSWVEADVKNRLHLLLDFLKHLAVRDIRDLEDKIRGLIKRYPMKEQNPTSLGYLGAAANKLWKPFSWITLIPNFLGAMNKSASPELSACLSRRPSQIHFIAHYVGTTDTVFKTHIYTTYDEQIDLWRKLVEVDDWPEHIFAVGHDIYFLFELQDGIRYNLIEKELIPLPSLNSPDRFEGTFANSDGLIYAIGGYDSETDVATVEVEAYTPQADAWHDVAPIVDPFVSAQATTIGKRIFVVGISPYVRGSSRMIAQVYSPGTDTWSLLPTPPTLRENFALAGYRGQLYILGGYHKRSNVKNVELLDSQRQVWFEHEPLPYAYFRVQATVLNDELIVHESSGHASRLKTNPPVRWDEDQKCWKHFDEASPMKEIPHYRFFSPDSDECTVMIAKENKDPRNVFTNSPFT